MAYGVRHNDYRPVALDRTDKCEADSLVAACGLNDDAVLVQLSVFLGMLDHVECRACLDRTADIKSFVLNENVSCALRYYVVELYERCVADSLKDVVINH